MYAKQKGLFTTTDYKDFYRIPELYLIIELTGKEDVLHEITQTKPTHIQLVDHVTARLFWDIFQIEEKRKQALEALKQANIFWENVFNCMQDFILVIDEEYNLITANQAVLEKTGLCKEEIKKKKFTLASPSTSSCSISYLLCCVASYLPHPLPSPTPSLHLPT